MIPRLHKRGTSFKGACSYILHDAGQTSAERVDWTLTRNLSGRDPKWAWHEMYETAAAQAQLKALAGQHARGRKNTRPVLHYTLSWAATEKPNREHMQQAALASLKAMGLQEHEALLAAHTDKQHMHVHIVVNTVHPVTGMTAPMKFTKLALSKWAEAYEREHGIHCEERIKNNEERRRLAAERANDPMALLSAASSREASSPEQPAKDPLAMLTAADAEKPRGRRPYVPVKHRAVSRRQWFEKKVITDRMKRLRAQMEVGHKIERNATWARQRKERDELDANTEAAVSQAKDYVRGQFKPQWRELYRVQRRELQFLEKQATHALERAVFVFSQRERLGQATTFTPRQMLRLIRKPGALLDRIDQIHERERRIMAQAQRAAAGVYTTKILDSHAIKFNALRSRQTDERHAQRDAQWLKTRTVSFRIAKEDLAKERANDPPPQAPPRPLRRAPGFRRLSDRFEDSAAPPPEPPLEQTFGKVAKPEPEPPSRAEQIRREMEEWRKKNDGQDFGHEI